MLDLTELLRLSRKLNQDIAYVKQIHQKPADLRNTVYVALDVELAEIANTAEWFKTWKTHKGKAQADMTLAETLLEEYVDAMDMFLWLALTEQWTHLVVLEEDELQKIARMPKRDLNAHYIGIKTMLWSAYHRKNQQDYAHAWHSFIKLGLVELGFTEDEIQTAFVKKNEKNEARLAADY
ncbi:2-deoxyuridine 5-triphosphate nucleotidohydrolase [Periweissella cryptocerci]|uniref:2-deoxyuridine 5-triphosphate nucleotidohydrolase n=1 Tax=Periweissella cryptocerci TaxID=2506420 RepID=A0A4V1AIF1_9LACO|nr:dUTP diphosphatase [Periweissella cryptocerci]QBO35285.1 2-deoxyuridine 5-triphosphate nucleotidohydrolase [Periweissella cryptocerci]